MKRALAVATLLFAPLAFGDDLANGLKALTDILSMAHVFETQRALGNPPELEPRIDPWGTPYRIDAAAYRIVSAGSDRKFDESTWTRSEQFAGTEGDVVFANGNFVRTNHNWLAGTAVPGASKIQLIELRKAEALLLGSRTAGMRKVIGAQITGSDMKNLGILIERYRQKHGSIAGLAGSADAVRTLLAEAGYPEYVPRDAWGTPFRLAIDGEHYRVISAGADRKFSPMTWTRPAANDPAEDLIFADGDFSRYIDAMAILASSDTTVQPMPQPLDPPYRPDKFVPIEKPIVPPVVVERKEPAYPEEYRKLRISGIVILEVAITETGSVEHIGLKKSLGPAMDMAAIDAVHLWSFKPATLDGKPVAVSFNLTINFKLTK